MDKELHEESDFIPADSSSIDPEQEKIRLIAINTTIFRKIVQTSLYFGVGRILVFILVMGFEETFILNEKGKDYGDSWNVIFYVVACLMDFLGTINDVTMLRFLKKDEENLQKVKKDLERKAAVVTETKAGSYETYLSIFSILKRYKYKSSQSVSISETIRFLHLVMTFYIFGNLALRSQGQVDDNYFKTIFFWVFLLSIFFNIFELDLWVYEWCDGPFLSKDSSKRVIQEEQKEAEQSQVSKSVKERFIKSRQPFEAFFIIDILVMLSIIVFFFQGSFFIIMLILCICAHIVQLIHEKHLQNKLLTSSLNQLPYKYLTPYKILSFITKSHRKINVAIRSFTRFTIVLLLMAYFRDQDTPMVCSFMFWILTMLFFMGQGTKFHRVEQAKLYVLMNCNDSASAGKECAICLLQCETHQKILQLPCFAGHVFHRKCMKNWLAERKECPLCRFSLEMYELE